MKRVLVVEDNTELAFGLRNNLEIEGYDVSVAADGAVGLAAAKRDTHDLVILDLMLPELDGFRVLKGIRESQLKMPVLILTAKGEESDKVRGLKMGADDYVTKPFGVEELLARLRAAMRRVETSPEPVIEVGDLRVDLEKRAVFGSGEPVQLTPHEFDLLRLFVQNRGKLLTHSTMLREVWGRAYSDESHYLHVYVSQLRRKIEPDPTRPQYILTEPGAGYRFVERLP